jgi:predicted nucleotidyltransferase
MAASVRITAEQVGDLPVLLRTVTGSEVHGTSLPGLGDIDHIAIALESREDVLGVGSSPESWQLRTAWKRGDSDIDNPASVIGDLDLTIYPARKWARLALEGNPNVITPLFVEDKHVVSSSRAGDALRANRHRFISKALAMKHLRYMKSQRSVLISQKGARVALVEQHGYDVKHAAHMLRVGHQGLSILLDLEPQIPLQPALADRIVAVRRGERRLDDVLLESHSLEAAIESAVSSSKAPDHADAQWVNEWLASAYLAAWR